MIVKIIRDFLLRVLGAYIDLSKESIQLDLRNCNLELHDLRLKAEALAMLFENLGLDLPVTVTAGYIGLLKVEVPATNLFFRNRPASVQILIHDLIVVASPVSDGDQTALEARDIRLKTARLAKDEAFRDAKFSVSTMRNSMDVSSLSTDTKSDSIDTEATTNSIESQSQPNSRRPTWGARYWNRVLNKIVDNIEIHVENVLVQYEDASSVRERPYTATVAFDSLTACSTDHDWKPTFIDDPATHILHKSVQMKGFVLNWEPGSNNNDLKSWIEDPNARREKGRWAELLQHSTRHAINPMDGELRVALTKTASIAMANSGNDSSLEALKRIPRVQMDIHFPDVKIGLDDFQYHTLLSTITYLSDIDRKVRPKKPKERWIWAVDRLLPRFKSRRDAQLQFSNEGIQRRRKTRIKYCEARNKVITAKRKGLTEPQAESKIVQELENELSYTDIIFFRDVADRMLLPEAEPQESGTWSRSLFSGIFSRYAPRTTSIRSSRTSQQNSGISTPRRSRSRDSFAIESNITEQNSNGTPAFDTSNKLQQDEQEGNADSADIDVIQDDRVIFQAEDVPSFRMGFLLGQGSIQLKEGGFLEEPVPFSSLEFRDLRFGIETGGKKGFLLESLLGKFEVIDLRKQSRVMYAHVPWSGDRLDKRDDKSDTLSSHSPSETNSSDDDDAFSDAAGSSSVVRTSSRGINNQSTIQATVLHSYPHRISEAISDIRGEYEFGDDFHPTDDTDLPSGSPYVQETISNSSHVSLSGLSDAEFSTRSRHGNNELPSAPKPQLAYIAALRLKQEEVRDGDWAQGATRMAMDLAIGGMEVIVDGQKGAFISSVNFWHPREKMPSIMQFLMRSAAPRLASLRMSIQKANKEKSVPMRMDLFIQGPRFVIPGPDRSNLSLVLNLGTFSMETSTGRAQTLSLEHENLNSTEVSHTIPDRISIRFTDYRMACSDLGLMVISKTEEETVEQIIKPFSVLLLLQVLHDSSYVETMTLTSGKVDVAKVKLQCQLPQLRTSLSREAFRQILDITKAWKERSRKTSPLPMPEIISPATMALAKASAYPLNKSPRDLSHRHSPLISFQMKLEFKELQLELRDLSRRRIVTITSTGTDVQMKKRSDSVDVSFKLISFGVVDGSRGATAPFRQLAYAGIDETKDCASDRDGLQDDPFDSSEKRAFIAMTYQGDLLNHEQFLAVKILSLNLVCVRETYFALTDFFYQKNNKEEVEEEYTDPFRALGMTTSSAARALRDQAGRGMEFSKQAFANRGQLKVTADLDGLSITLVSAEGAIACFDVSDSTINLVQLPTGTITANGTLGGFGIRDLTASYDVYSETIRYCRSINDSINRDGLNGDGWELSIPGTGEGEIWLKAHLRNLRLVYLQRFIIILKKYFDVLRESLRPVIQMKGGIGEVFDDEVDVDLHTLQDAQNRVRINLITENIDVVMPRHSQSPYEALRFYVPRSSISNEDIAAPGYKFGFKLTAENVDAYVLYAAPAKGEGRALTNDGTEPTLRYITPNVPLRDIVPFSRNINISAKIDSWRRRKVPEVVLNTDGIPVLKDGEEEREYDPSKWLPTIRVRVSAPDGIVARLCEAEYSILYFTFTENVIERPDIEFTDIVRGLKTPVLPTRKPVQPIMFSSNRMPPNYQILFEVPRIESIIMSGAEALDETAKLIRTELHDLVGCFEYGVDYRMSVEVNADMNSLYDIRPSAPRPGMKLIMPTKRTSGPLSTSSHNQNGYASNAATDVSRSVTLTWDRPFGFAANIMVVASDLRVVIIPELFRDLGLLTPPGFPYLKSSAPAPLLRFNGRRVILTIARPEIWLMADQYSEDKRSLVIRGDVIAKILWAPVTGRNSVEVSASRVQVCLSNLGPWLTQNGEHDLRSIEENKSDISRDQSSEIPMLYPSDISLRFEGRGYDPPKKPGEEPTKVLGSTLTIDAEAILVRIDVNDAPLILAVGSRLANMQPSVLSSRPLQPGRFDEWRHNDEEGDLQLIIDFRLPHCRLMFTDEIAGRYVPIMEGRLKHVVLSSKVPIATEVRFELSLDLFNEEKGWWEPGLEVFPIDVAAATDRSGSQRVRISAQKIIEVNVTPNTVSGATRVIRALKSAVQDLKSRLRAEEIPLKEIRYNDSREAMVLEPETNRVSEARRPSVAMFCVRNETGRPIRMSLRNESQWQEVPDGKEVEVDTPSEELLWTAMGTSSIVGSNTSAMNRKTMSCRLHLSGYKSVIVDAKEVGNRLLQLSPERRDSSTKHLGSESVSLTLLWSVSMRDGVPFCCIRSLIRLVNRTKLDLETNIVSPNKKHAEEPISMHTRSDYQLIRAGQAFSVPIHSMNEEIRIRPALSPYSKATTDSHDENGNSELIKKYPSNYSWSRPLGSFVDLYQDGRRQLHKSRTKRKGSSNHDADSTLISCTEGSGVKTFYASISTVVDARYVAQQENPQQSLGWVDVEICTPLLLENLLPRRMVFRLFNSPPSHPNSHMLVAQGVVQPGSEFHVHSVGSDFARSSIALAVDNTYNSDAIESKEAELGQLITDEFQFDLPKVNRIKIGGTRSIPFTLGLAHEQLTVTRHIRMYSDFWIRNRSDTDLFFRDQDYPKAPSNVQGPKVYLRSRPPGTKTDDYICFSGKWVSFQRAGTVEDIWTSVHVEVPEIDKPIPIRLEGLSLLLEVRPARGKFSKSLIITVRNAVWIENRTGSSIEWCQPAALNSSQIALSNKVHLVRPGKCVPLHWDFQGRKKAIRIRRVSGQGSSSWIWSCPVLVEGVEGEFPAKMYLPKHQRQYIARVVVSKLSRGASLVIVHKEDRNAPPFKIVNNCVRRGIAFRQSGVSEGAFWFVSPKKTTRYSWDDPQAPAKHRSLIVEVVTQGDDDAASSSAAIPVDRIPGMRHSSSSAGQSTTHIKRSDKTTKYPKFLLNIETVEDLVKFSNSEKFNPPLLISVYADGPTKIVTFSDGDERGTESQEYLDVTKKKKADVNSSNVDISQGKGKNIDLYLSVRGVGISLVAAGAIELAYLSISGIRFILERNNGEQCIRCVVQDLQLDNQLTDCTWPVALWSPPPPKTTNNRSNGQSSTTNTPPSQKPFFQFILDGPYPPVNRGIGSFEGIFVALQQLQIAADEDFVLRSWLFAVSLIEAAGGNTHDGEEPFDGSDIHEVGLPESLLNSNSVESSTHSTDSVSSQQKGVLLNRLCVKNLELCPLKLTVSFTSSRNPSATEHIGGYRSLIRTLIAMLGNVENAEFRFNALQLQDVNDTASHFGSLIIDYYVAQGSNQKIVLLASNSLIGNPSALFESIAKGTRDFFVEPANAKGSTDFLASLGRGSSSLLTNTVGSIAGVIARIPGTFVKGIEIAVGDSEYLAERDAIRGGKARAVSSPFQGTVRGVLSVGHGIASGAAGLVRYPIQGAAEEGPSGFIKGLGKGVIGGVLKPLTGALDMIAEPAAGFQNMMMAQRNHVIAEPVRPRRVFGGVHSDRMLRYDFHESLGQAILTAVNTRRNDGDHANEKLRAWQYLVVVRSNATEEDVTRFLWALLRRSLYSSNFQARPLEDAQGTPQRAENIRVCLITDERIITTSLDGLVTWHCSLIHIISDEDFPKKDGSDLWIKWKSPGHHEERQRVSCGLRSSTDALHSNLQSALLDIRNRSGDFAHTSSSNQFLDNENSTNKRSTGNTSREMDDLSVPDPTSTETEMKVFRERRPVVGLELPGRRLQSNLEEKSNLDADYYPSNLLPQRLKTLKDISGEYPRDTVRCVRIFFVNQTEKKLELKRDHLQVGIWSKEPPSEISPYSVVMIEAIEMNDRVTDLSGSISYTLNEDGKSDKLIAVRFLNPMLAGNAYGTTCPAEFSLSQYGGEKGDHITTEFTFQVASADERCANSELRKSKISPEPLLFGRSQVSPELPPVIQQPPHIQRKTRPNPKDPNLIDQLTSLGFSEAESITALQTNDADVSKSYSWLMSQREDENNMLTKL